MAEPGPDRKLLPSVLDRLIDHDPRSMSDNPAVAATQLSQMKQAVRRDLTWLFNSKRPLPEQPASRDHLNRSLLGYGLPDFTTSSLSNPTDQDFLLRSVIAAVTRFEPRISDLRVSLDEPRPNDRTIRFRVEGVLNVEPNPEFVSFDSVLQLHTKAFKVEAD